MIYLLIPIISVALIWIGFCIDELLNPNEYKNIRASSMIKKSSESTTFDYILAIIAIILLGPIIFIILMLDNFIIRPFKIIRT